MQRAFLFLRLSTWNACILSEDDIKDARKAPLQKQIFVGEPALGLPLQILCNPREGEGALPYI